MEIFRESDVSDLTDFQFHERWYLLDGNLEEVWSLYTEISPAAQWNGPIAHFGLLYDPNTSAILTPANRDFPPIEVGNILFLDLLIEEILHVTTSFQISRLDNQTKTIEFTYLEQNTSHGCQELKFYPAEGGTRTLIRHRSHFKSESPLRDALFYRPYHNQTVDEFHWTVAKQSGMNLDVMRLREVKKKGLLPSEQPLESIITTVSY